MALFWPVAFSVFTVLGSSSQPVHDPSALLREADRLAWLRAWSAAESMYDEAARRFTASGDERNALYARMGHLRARLPRLALPDVAAALDEYLEHPLVQADERLQLRCLVIKGEVEEDLDPLEASKAWSEAQRLADKLGDAAWSNRAKGELGVVAFLQGDINGGVVGLGDALKVAQSNGDISSQVRWLTLFGHGYVELGRPEEALDFYDRALTIAAAVPELQFPMMTYSGRVNALVRLKRTDEANQILTKALTVAEGQRARGYQAELLKQQALLAYQSGNTPAALALLERATDLAKAAGANRIVAEVELELARVQRAARRVTEAEKTLRHATAIARAMQERMLLPRLLAEFADLRAAEGHILEASRILEEASDLLEGLFTSTSSPWVQSRLASGMNDVFVARIRLEGSRPQNLARMFQVVEQARGRSLLELLVNRPLDEQVKPEALRAGERRIAALQKQLFLTSDRAARQRLLDQIFTAEERLAPMSIALFERTRRSQPQGKATLRTVQRALKPDELFLEFALADPHSYVIVVTPTSARVVRVPGRTTLREQIVPLLKKVRDGDDDGAGFRQLADALLGPISELRTQRRVIVSADGELHNLPFELLPGADGARLLSTHVVSYVPSGAVLAVLRASKPRRSISGRTLAISASLVDTAPTGLVAKADTRGVYDLDITKIRALPAADDEVQAIGSILGSEQTTVLIGGAATEADVKRLPLHEFQVVHFAAHGIPSTKFPARSALLLRPSDDEDGVLQAREILGLRLDADLVTLSACDTGSGSLHGQDGVTSLVRPFVAAGARTVVANLWAADDAFSLALMREFYRQLASGADIAEGLRAAKLRMLEMFGPRATPQLWSGVLAYGDGTGRLAPGGATQTR